jgi:hypothetical protein
LIANDVGVGKTVEAGLVAREHGGSALQRLVDGEEGQPSSAAAQAFVDGSTTEQIDDLGLENEPAEEAIEADEDATAEAATEVGVVDASGADLRRHRKLQAAKQVFCRYFRYEQREADIVLEALVRKTEVIREQLGSAGQVIEKRITDRLAAEGIDRGEAKALAKAIEDETHAERLARARAEMMTKLLIASSNAVRIAAPPFSDTGLIGLDPIHQSRNVAAVDSPRLLRLAWPAPCTVPVPVPAGGSRAPRAFFDSMPAGIVLPSNKLKSL